MRHVQPLDGIRGIAVLMVLCFHYGYFPPGWIGVQVFFTLSGFLITTILLRTRDESFSSFITNFYWHRAIRIFPVLYLFVTLAGITYALTGEPASFPSDWPWLASFTANFARMRPGDLGDCFVHIWSLAVEQQFYLVWPLLVFFLPGRSFRYTVAGLLLLTPLLRFLLFQGLITSGHTMLYAGKAAYVLPFTQFDAFAAGAAIPLWRLEGIKNAWRWFLVAVAVTGIAGFLVLCWAYFVVGGAFIGSLGYAMFLLESEGYVWGYSLLNVVSMLGIVCALQGVSAARLLGTRFLVWVGQISYGVYVYHVPLLRVFEYLLRRLGLQAGGSLRPIVFLMWVGSVLLISSLSYRWFEAPILRLRNIWRPRKELSAPSA